MLQFQNAPRAWSFPEGRSHRSGRNTPRFFEMLEARTLLSATPSVLTRMGTIKRPSGTGTVLLQVQPGQFKAPSGKILFNVEIAVADGSQFFPRSFQVLGPVGKRIVASVPVRSGASVFRRVLVAPGNYSVRVAGRGNSTGAFEVFVHMVGDVNGDRVVNQADLSAIRTAVGEREGEPGYAANLDGNQNGVIGKADVRQARINLGANAGKTFTFSLTDSTGGTFNADNVYVAILGNSRGTNVRLDSSGNQVPMNSQFWHQHSLNNLAYGFDYDDVFDQSSSINDASPSGMKINVTWG